MLKKIIKEDAHMTFLLALVSNLKEPPMSNDEDWLVTPQIKINTKLGSQTLVAPMVMVPQP